MAEDFHVQRPLSIQENIYRHFKYACPFCHQTKRKIPTKPPRIIFTFLHSKQAELGNTEICRDSFIGSLFAFPVQHSPQNWLHNLYIKRFSLHSQNQFICIQYIVPTRFNTSFDSSVSIHHSIRVESSPHLRL